MKLDLCLNSAKQFIIAHEGPDGIGGLERIGEKTLRISLVSGRTIEVELAEEFLQAVRAGAEAMIVRDPGRAQTQVVRAMIA